MTVMPRTILAAVAAAIPMAMVSVSIASRASPFLVLHQRLLKILQSHFPWVSGDQRGGSRGGARKEEAVARQKPTSGKRPNDVWPVSTPPEQILPATKEFLCSVCHPPRSIPSDPHLPCAPFSSRYCLLRHLRVAFTSFLGGFSFNSPHHGRISRRRRLRGHGRYEYILFACHDF